MLSPLEVAFHKLIDPVRDTCRRDSIKLRIVWLDVNDRRPVDRIETAHGDILLSNGEQLHGGEPKIIRPVFRPLGEYAHLWHLLQAAGASLEVSRWIERCLMEIGDNDHMREGVEPEKTRSELGSQNNL